MRTRRWVGAAVIAVTVALLAACGGGDSRRIVDIEASNYAEGPANAAAMAFDAHGRLWVATAAYDDSGNDSVYVVDGSGASPTQVITDAHTPLGLLWVGDTLYVAATGGVTVYSGFDGTAFSERRVVVALPDGVGEVNGLALSSDGRISLGVSAPCDSCTPTSEYSATVLSFLPDGSDLRVDAKGIRAPIGLTYFPGTDRLFVTMNQRDDLGAATPGDWLSIVENDQDWGFPDCYGQGGNGCEDAPSPIAELDPHAAVSGVAIVTGQLGDAVGTAAIVAEWAKGVLLMVPLTDDGSAATGPARTLLTGIQNPVAVTLGPDGALYAADWATGTVSRITATSQTALTAP